MADENIQTPEEPFVHPLDRMAEADEKAIQRFIEHPTEGGEEKPPFEDEKPPEAPKEEPPEAPAPIEEPPKEAKAEPPKQEAKGPPEWERWPALRQAQREKK